MKHFRFFKIPLHWQILFAIASAAVFGVYFPTQYKFTPDSFETFRIETEEFNSFEIGDLEHMISDAPRSKADFFVAAETYTKKALLNSQKTEIIKKTRYNPAVSRIEWFGVIFLRALKMIIIPLILSSIISGIANINTAEDLGRISLKTILYYLSSSTIAILIGLGFVNLLKPGVGVELNLSEDVSQIEFATSSFFDTLLNIVPDNIFKAFAAQDMLAVIFFAILFGFFITKIAAKQRELLTNFFNATNDVMMKMTMFIIRFTPLGVFGIVAKTIADNAEQLPQMLQGLGMYSLTVFLGLVVHMFVMLPLFLYLSSKANPFKVLKAMRTALLTAFSTSSSAATISVTLHGVQNNCGVSNKVSGFSIPLGSTVNMDGTALYEGVVALFIAQAYGIDLTLADQVIVLITALLASIGAAGVPMAGLIMTSVVLSAVGLPLEGIGLILSVDKILDMFRTTVNVWSDSCGAVIIAKSEGEQLNV
jgi:Na+/H+-dicarboxylate symporter